MSETNRRTPENSINRYLGISKEILRTTENFDQAVDRFFEPLRQNQVLNRLFYAASGLADHSVIWFLLAALKAARSKEQARIAKRAAIALAIESVVVNLGVKSLFRRQRPEFPGNRPLPLRQPLTSSFPSGHSSAAVCAYLFLSEDDALAPLYLLLAAIIAPSRIHVKIHHASDVIGGLLVGWLLARIIKAIYPK
ncbi:MAG: phosphatase PAP2 family protein [Actinobacteria bacterium]|nr:phosphatase PAP2 family protein [Actinomycetota bacterium]